MIAISARGLRWTEAVGVSSYLNFGFAAHAIIEETDERWLYFVPLLKMERNLVVQSSLGCGSPCPLFEEGSSDSLESLFNSDKPSGCANQWSSFASAQENSPLRTDRPHHRRTRTGSTARTLESFNGSLRSVSSVPDRVSQVPSNTGLKRPPTMQDLSSLVTLTDPKVLKMHRCALNALANTTEALTSYLCVESRDYWEEANRSFGKAVKVAAHLSLWAQHDKPAHDMWTEPSVSGGEAVLPGWYSWGVFAWTQDSRCRRRRLLAEEALQRAKSMHVKQTAVLTGIWSEVEAVNLASTRTSLAKAKELSRERNTRSSRRP